MKNTLILFCLLIGLSTSAIHAQAFFDKLGAGINFDVKSPLGTLRDNGLTNYYGLSLELFYVGCTDKKIRFTPGYRLNGGLTKSITGNRVIVAQPEGAEATEQLFNAFYGFELVGRAIYDDGHIFRPYAEVYAGPRMTAGYETLTLINSNDEYNDSYEKVFSNSSITGGAGLGALVKLSYAIDLNFKMTTEYTKQIGHSNLDQPDNYTTQKIESHNAFNHSFTIGVFFRPICGRLSDSSKKRNRRSSSKPYRRSHHWNKTNNTKPKPIQRTSRS